LSVTVTDGATLGVVLRSISYKFSILCISPGYKVSHASCFPPENVPAIAA